MKTPQLSPQSTEIIAATVGVVAENAVEITRTFYPRHLVLQRRGPLQQ